LGEAIDSLALGIGQIVRAPDFEYIDALGALEIMDPKTDSGMTLGDDDIDDSPKVDGLLPEEILWIMDQLLAREVYQNSFHSPMNYRGPLDSATFLRTLPPLEPTFEQNLVSAVLRSYVLGVGRGCDCIREELQKGNIYEVPGQRGELILICEGGRYCYEYGGTGFILGGFGGPSCRPS
jgi:N-alpha-acetyltransferase 35, NatC auxiliary subunit